MRRVVVVRAGLRSSWSPRSTGLVVRIAVTAARLGEPAAEHVADGDRGHQGPRFLAAEVIELLGRDQDGGDHTGHRIELGGLQRTLRFVEGAADRNPALDGAIVDVSVQCCHQGYSSSTNNSMRTTPLHLNI